MKKELTYEDDKSDKFWTIEVSGKSFTVTYGKTGSAGTSQTKKFTTPDACKKEAEKLVNEKLKKGYRAGKAKSAKPVAKKVKKAKGKTKPKNDKDPMKATENVLKALEKELPNAFPSQKKVTALVKKALEEAREIAKADGNSWLEEYFVYWWSEFPFKLKTTDEQFDLISNAYEKLVVDEDDSDEDDEDDESDEEKEEPTPIKKGATSTGKIYALEECLVGMDYKNDFLQDNYFNPVFYFSKEAPLIEKEFKKGMALTLEQVILGITPNPNSWYDAPKLPRITLPEALLLAAGEPYARVRKEFDDNNPVLDSVADIVYRGANDLSKRVLDHERQKFIKLIPMMLNSKTKARRTLLECCELGVSWYFQTGLPFWLEAAGRTKEADAIRKLSIPKNPDELNVHTKYFQSLSVKLYGASEKAELKSTVSSAVGAVDRIVYVPTGKAIADYAFEYWPGALKGFTASTHYREFEKTRGEVWDIRNFMNDTLWFACRIYLQQLSEKIQMPKKLSGMEAQIGSVLIAKAREATASIQKDSWWLLKQMLER